MPASPFVPVTLVASRISCELGGRLVLKDVSLTVGAMTRLGVVGPNGVGKSTLLKVLAGRLRPDSGTVELAPPAATVGYLAQEPERRGGETVRAYLRRATGVEAAEVELLGAAEGLGAGGEEAAGSYSVALERWQRLGAADVDARRASTSRFDVTLLDEPTNDVDFEGLARLERFVAGHPGVVVVVSHDRAFLEHAVTSILELDGHDRRARLFRGGWIAYLDERATARRHAEEAHADYAAKRRLLLERARRERRWATTGAAKEKRRGSDRDKVQRDFRLNRTEHLAARARRTERALARLEPVEKPWEGWDLRFEIAEAPRAGAIVVRLEEAVVERGGWCLGPIDVEIAWGERIALTGPNGSGKTTLLEAVLGRIPLRSGSRWLGPSVVVGELGQGRRALAGPAPLLAAFVDATALHTAAARSLLAKFGLGADHVVRRVDSLSPGERTRGELAGFQARSVNFLVLDEPTNHLDLPAVEQLEEALVGYRGTLIVVSHDRRFLEALDLERTIELGGRR